MLSGFPVDLIQSSPVAPVVGDINGDGYLNIIVATNTQVRVFNHNGTESSGGWPAALPTGYTPVGAPAVGDLDHDGNLEVVVCTESGTNAYLCVYGNDGNPKGTYFPYFFSGQKLTPPALADITDDGPVEIVLASTLFSGGGWDNARYYVFDADGNKTVDESLDGYGISVTPAVGDFVPWPEWPGKEVVLIGSDPPNHHILARTAATGAYRNHIFMGDEVPTSAPTIGDVNHQSTNEVVIGCQGRLMAYDLACGAVPFAGQWDGTLYGDVSTPIITDLNGDTHCDIICGDGEALYAFTTTAFGGNPEDFDWIREGHDNLNTGLWDIAAPTGLVAEDYAEDQGGKILLAWTPSIDDGVRSNRVTNYEIYRTAGEAGPPGGDGDRATMPGVSKKMAEGRLAAARRGEAFLTAGASPGSPAALGPNAADGDEDSGIFALIATVPDGTFYYEDDDNGEGLENLFTYEYYIVATDGTHDSQPSKVVEGVPHDNVAPAPPTDPACVVVNNGMDPVHVVVSWTRSYDDPLYHDDIPDGPGSLITDTVAIPVPAGPGGAAGRETGTAAGRVPSSDGSAAAAFGSGDAAGAVGRTAPAGGPPAFVALGEKQGEAAKAKRAQSPDTPKWLYPPSVPRYWTGKDGGLDAGAGDVVTYKIWKNDFSFNYYPDTPGNTVEYVDWEVSGGNIYYYTISALDGEPNESEGAGPVVADLTSIEDNYGGIIASPWLPTAGDAAYNPYGPPNVAAPTVEAGWGASRTKTSRVITCKPNPVTGTATFTITLPAACSVRLDVYDISGRKVDTVLNKTVRAGGEAVTWTPAVPNGIYVYRLETGTQKYSGRVAVAR